MPLGHVNCQHSTCAWTTAAADKEELTAQFSRPGKRRKVISLEIIPSIVLVARRNVTNHVVLTTPIRIYTGRERDGTGVHRCFPPGRRRRPFQFACPAVCPCRQATNTGLQSCMHRFMRMDTRSTKRILHLGSLTIPAVPTTSCKLVMATWCVIMRSRKVPRNVLGPFFGSNPASPSQQVVRTAIL